MAKLVNISVTAKPSGELENASATLQCRLIPADLRASAGDWVGSLKFADGLAKTPHWAEINMQLDGPSPEGGDIRKVHMLILRHFFDLEDVEAYVETLVIAPSADHPGCYQRIGVWGLAYGTTADKEDHIVTSLILAYREIEDQTIELV